jgi:hypothetical protein
MMSFEAGKVTKKRGIQRSKTKKAVREFRTTFKFMNKF